MVTSDEIVEGPCLSHLMVQMCYDTIWGSSDLCENVDERNSNIIPILERSE